eukprot:scaffold97694_cov65-Phaeocystis_antarctica.AAC.2
MCPKKRAAEADHAKEPAEHDEHCDIEADAWRVERVNDGHTARAQRGERAHELERRPCVSANRNCVRRRHPERIGRLEISLRDGREAVLYCINVPHPSEQREANVTATAIPEAPANSESIRPIASKACEVSTRVRPTKIVEPTLGERAAKQSITSAYSIGQGDESRSDATNRRAWYFQISVAITLGSLTLKRGCRDKKRGCRFGGPLISREFRPLISSTGPVIALAPGLDRGRAVKVGSLPVTGKLARAVGFSILSRPGGISSDVPVGFVTSE